MSFSVTGVFGVEINISFSVDRVEDGDQPTLTFSVDRMEVLGWRSTFLFSVDRVQVWGGDQRCHLSLTGGRIGDQHFHLVLTGWRVEINVVI